MLQSPETPLGERWAILVKLWVEFEKKEGFKEHGFLPAKGRPECVSEWIRRGRPPGWMPTITASKLETAFKAWWLSLQPKGRVSRRGAIIATDLESGGWEVLRKPGLNGLLSALVGLFYWGGALKRSAKQHAAWATCVEDCILVLGPWPPCRMSGFFLVVFRCFYLCVFIAHLNTLVILDDLT